MNRRLFMGSLGLLGLGGLTALTARLNASEPDIGATVEKLVLSDTEWKSRLNQEQYNILRDDGTERAFTSSLNKEYRDGTYVCAGCGLALFMSATKFDSRTGWPSFFKPIKGHIETRTDFKLILPRTEYHCARCGGHQGHVFNDGPEPTGQRWCNNGVALKFVPAEKT